MRASNNLGRAIRSCKSTSRPLSCTCREGSIRPALLGSVSARSPCRGTHWSTRTCQLDRRRGMSNAEDRNRSRSAPPGSLRRKGNDATEAAGRHGLSRSYWGPIPSRSSNRHRRNHPCMSICQRGTAPALSSAAQREASPLCSWCAVLQGRSPPHSRGRSILGRIRSARSGRTACTGHARSTCIAGHGRCQIRIQRMEPMATPVTPLGSDGRSGGR